MKRGKIYGIFPVDIEDDMTGVQMTDCWINRYLFWLFEILNTIEGCAAAAIGVEHLFWIKIDKRDLPKKEK